MRPIPAASSDWLNRQVLAKGGHQNDLEVAAKLLVRTS